MPSVYESSPLKFRRMFFPSTSRSRQECLQKHVQYIITVASIERVREVGRPSPRPQRKWKKIFVTAVKMFYALPSLECVRCIFEINVGLLLTADNSVPVSPWAGDGSKVDRNSRRSGRPPRFCWNDATASLLFIFVITHLSHTLCVQKTWHHKICFERWSMITQRSDSC